MGELDQLQADWDDMAEINPLWFLAPSDRVSNRTWTIEEFFQSGRSHTTRDLAMIHEAGIPLARGSVLDFGCGVGRQTQALAAEFDVCYGVDISPRMIELANSFNRFGDRCRYVVRPIALTGLAAMAGAFFILDDPIFSGLAVSLIFGILVSTVLTLVVIPVISLRVPLPKNGTGG